MVTKGTVTIRHATKAFSVSGAWIGDPRTSSRMGGQVHTKLLKTIGLIPLLLVFPEGDFVTGLGVISLHAARSGVAEGPGF